MGMFDSVWVNCPKCGNTVEFQSKAGECDLLSYGINNIPIGIADDIKNDSEQCSNCLSIVKLNVQSMVVVNQYTE